MSDIEELAKAKSRMTTITDRLLDIKVKKMGDEVRKDLMSETPDYVDVRIKVAELQGDVTHIMKRMDEGIAPTLKSINESMQSVLELKPVIAHHAEVIKGLEGIGWWLVYGLLAGVVATIIWAITKGLKF